MLLYEQIVLCAMSLMIVSFQPCAFEQYFPKIEGNWVFVNDVQVLLSYFLLRLNIYNLYQYMY